MALDELGNPIVTLDLGQRERILTYLGYRANSTYLADWSKYMTKLTQIYPEYVVERVTGILQELVELDEALVSARGESMAKVVDKLTLDYRQHIKHLHRDGYNLLIELATLLELTVVYSKYKNSQRSVSVIGWG